MNHLANSTSPYLLQHADNPVEWYPWGEQALARARAENKPIFLSIGYAACHWCHVMAHESFEDPDTSAMMNESFINIKVDREERPDLDAIYMQVTVSMVGSGGWPMSVFLTPDLRPFYAGTYYPPVSRFNLPSFQDVLRGIATAWKKDPGEAIRVGNQVALHLENLARQPGRVQPFTLETLEQAMQVILGVYDWGSGGWGDAPKFPQPMTIEFLLRRAAPEPNNAAWNAASHALKAMARGGMYDVVGGGFSRYSTDQSWKVPHFEKMLYDNAQLALAYLHAWQLSGESFFKRIAVETLDFVSRELSHPDGGFYSSLDADSEQVEGKFYVWTRQEIRAALLDDADFEFFAEAYGITERGNWEGTNVLQRSLDDATLASRFKTDVAGVVKTLGTCHAQLLEARAHRTRPATDDKVLTAWNGLMLQAYAQAARYFDDDRKRSEYYAVAARNADFLLSSRGRAGRLFRSWRNGAATREVFLDDYAALILGLLDLYQTDFDNKWFKAAGDLAEEMLQRFADPAGGLFDTPAGGEELLVRPKDLQDNAVPSGNALACEALARLYAYTDNGRLRERVEIALALVTQPASRYPTAFARWLSVADFTLGSVQQIAILYDAPDEASGKMISATRQGYRPNIVVAAARHPPAAGSPALLQDRPLINKMATAYVCQGFVCKTPVNDPGKLSVGPGRREKKGSL